MDKKVTHIVSKCRWNTSFDQKAKAHELQARLSNWSRGNMQQEITEIFDRICPPEEIWKIRRLELDLGIIDFNELEPELAVKLRKQLRQKLLDLIFYASNHNLIDIEILNENISRIDLLYAFLLNGVMPWNYRPEDGSVNQLLEHQLKNNRQNLVAMLLELGASRENVRRRIAWQVSEANIIKIIEGLEPANSDHVIEFTNEMTKIQAKETIVQSDAVDFKKNLWFWVLNYLFTNHGSAFNKKEFLKSSIRQMADHYNTSYDELFDLIEQAIEKAGQLTAVRGDFLLTLKVLSKEKKTRESQSSFGASDDVARPWSVLKNYFLDVSAHWSVAKHKEFNELVARLSGQDEESFRDLLNTPGDPGIAWLQTADRLNDASLGIIARVLSPAGSAMFLQHIHFLEILCREPGLQVERNVLWEIGISYLYRQKDAVFNSQAFMRYCTGKLGSRNRYLLANILEHLVSKGIPDTIQSISFFEIYSEFTTALVSGISIPQTVQYKKLLNDLINDLSGQFAAEVTNKNKFSALQTQFIRSMKLSPKINLQILLEFRDKDQLQKLLPYLLDEHRAMMLIKYTKHEKPAILAYISQVVRGMKTDKKTKALAAFIDRNLFSAGLQLILVKPWLNQSKFLELLLEKLCRVIPVAMLGQFGWFVYKLFAPKKLYGYGIAAAVEERILATYCGSRKPFILEEVIQLIRTSRHSQDQAGALLSLHFESNEFIQLRRSNRSEGHTILSYFLAGGPALMQGITGQYALMLNHQLKTVAEIEIRYRLNELFWKCILDYRAHSGKEKEFRALFQKAVGMSFRVPGQEQAISAGQNVPTLEEDTVIADKGSDLPGEYFLVIEQCLETGSSSITHNGKDFHLKEMVNDVLNSDPSILKGMIAKFPATAQRIEMIKRVTDFCRFSSWILPAMDNKSRILVETMRFFYDVAGKIPIVKNADTLHSFYWKELWTLIHTSTLPHGGAKKLADDSFSMLTKEAGKNAGEVLSIMEKHGAWLNPGVRNVLQESVQAGSAAPVSDEIAFREGKLLKAVHLDLLQELCSKLISEMKIPVWFDDGSGQLHAKDLVNEIVQHYPIEFLMVLKRKTITASQMFWLTSVLDFNGLAGAMAKLNSGQSLPGTLVAFFAALGKMKIEGISSTQIQEILFEKVLKAWITGDWKMIMSENILAEIFRDLITKCGTSEKQLLLEFDKHRTYLPGPLKISLDRLKDNRGKIIREENLAVIKPQKQELKKQNWPSLAGQGIAVKNAGLVIVSGYIKLLFEKLAVTADDKFLNDTSRAHAVHYLQYLVTGLTDTDESLLPLNKVLCGLPLDEPVPAGIEIPGSHRELIEGLLRAIIGYWPSIGDSSLDGFRGNWFVRDGLLAEQEDKWELTVEKRSYDLLIGKSPFSFSVIRYPWMDKPLHVNWQY